MSVENPDVVDVLSTSRDGLCVVLTIADHLPWDDSNEHLMILQEKLNRYLAFIESGELVERHPKAIDRAVRIEIEYLYQPSADGDAFLRRSKEIIEAAGFRFAWSIASDETRRTISGPPPNARP